MLKRFLIIFISIFMISPVYSKNINGNWHNDLRSLFLKNSAIIYTINIRTFGANDVNKNEIIDGEEESGNFLNAINELDNLVKMGINTIHVLPVLSVGKVKAFGTAGSLYAISSFTEINPQLVSKQSSSDGITQAKRFVKECHKRNIRVIIDLPSCGSYDMYLVHPEYFIKDENGSPVIPLDWTDVRLFNADISTSEGQEVLKEHKLFIDMVLNIGADGIRADVARIKSQEFWKELIDYARQRDKEFLFLAEASYSLNEPVSKYSLNTSVEQLFKSGFDGYLGSYFNLKNMKNAKELISIVESDIKLFEKYDNQKSVIGSFSTHDEVSPIQVHGNQFSKMIIWLNTTLPLNPYYVDGFATGDTYIYQWANKFASDSQTDDEYYFTHNGQIDIFNFSRKPGGADISIYNEFLLANKFRNYYAQDLSNAKFVPLKSSNPKVFAYARVTNNMSIVVIGNLDFENNQISIIKIPKFKYNQKILNLRVQKTVNNEYIDGKIKATLTPGDIEVLLIKHLVF